MRKTLKFQFTLFLLSLLILTGCKKEKEELPDLSGTPSDTTGNRVLINFLARATGTEVSEIKYQPSTGTFEIDGDLSISREETEKHYEKSRTQADSRTSHYRYQFLVSDNYIINIKIFIEPTVSSVWSNALNSAINNWNAVTGTKLYFSRVTSAAGADIVIKNGGSATDIWLAQATPPTADGRPGPTILINTYKNLSGISSSKILFGITHELGHNIGLLHTNKTDGLFIPGTPATDPSSIMNSEALEWKAFTSGDITAVRTLYPEDSFWRLLPGTAYDISVNKSGQAWIIGTTVLTGGFSIHNWNGSSWTTVSGAATSIAVNRSNIVYVTNNRGEIYRGGTSGWTLLPGRANDIAVSDNGNVWSIGTVAVGGGFNIQYWNGSSWITVPGGGVRIAVDPSNLPWVINRDNDVYRRTASGTWEFIPGKSIDIAISAEGTVYRVSNEIISGGYRLYKWHGSGWIQIDGAGVRISGGGLPWVVNSAMNIYRRY